MPPKPGTCDNETRNLGFESSQLRPLGWAPATSLQNALTEFTHPTRSTGPALTSFAVAVARPDERFGDFVPNRAAVTTTGERAFHVPAVP
jgi:hypothetical protein